MATTRKPADPRAGLGDDKHGSEFEHGHAGWASQESKDAAEAAAAGEGATLITPPAELAPEQLTTEPVA